MKKMKTYKYLGLTLVSLFFAISCTQEDVDETLKVDHVGGYIDVVSSSLSYVVGNDASYPISLVAYNGNDPIEKIDVYNTYSTSTGETSNTVLLKTINVTPSGNKGGVNFSVTFEDLIQGVVFDGAPLPADDTNLNIGDGFTLTYVAYVSSGESSTSKAKTKLTVSTRFAGNYKVVRGDYWRLGVFRDDVAWPEQVTIESVDATTYRMIKWYGAFEGDDWYFQVQPDLSITYPTLENGDPQAPTGYPQTTCALNAGDLTHVFCGDSNYVELDNDNGKDKMYMTYGYMYNVGGSSDGPREFYAILEKIVD